MTNVDARWELGIVGLGRIGFRLAQRFRDVGCRVIAFDSDSVRLSLLPSEGMSTVAALEGFASNLAPPRLVVLLVPAGEAVEGVVVSLLESLSPGDLVVDMGNSHPSDSARRWALCRGRRIRFLDIGTSGGVSGARAGPCLTVGGEREDFLEVEPLLQALAGSGGCFYAGPPGWGHLAKVVHNGIEYGFLQAIGEGLELLAAAAQRQGGEIDLAELCRAWSKGSIISSRLVADAAEAVGRIQRGEWTSAVAGGGETGRWAADLAKQHEIPVPALEAALFARSAKGAQGRFSTQLVSAIRNVFGEHPPAKV